MNNVSALQVFREEKISLFKVLFVSVSLLWPFLKIADYPFPTMLLLGMILLVYSPPVGGRNVSLREVYLLVGSCSLLALSIFINVLFYGVERYDIKDYSYVTIPAIWFLTYYYLCRVSAYEIVLAIRIFLGVTVFLCVLQLLNPYGFNESVIVPLARMATGENIAGEEQLSLVTVRPFGLFGNPVWCGFAAYFCAFADKAISGKSYSMAVAFLIAILTGSRTALAIIVVTESFYYAPQVWKVISGKMSVGSVLFFSFLLLLALYILMNSFIGTYYGSFESLSQARDSDYSLFYRLETAATQFGRNDYNLLSGGSGWREFPEYVDSEYVMRVLQFGVLGLVGFKLYSLVIPFMVLITRDVSRSWKNYLLLSLVVSGLAGSITFFISSTPYFVYLYAVVYFAIASESEMPEE